MAKEFTDFVTMTAAELADDDILVGTDVSLDRNFKMTRAEAELAFGAGGDYQPLDDQLTALASLGSVANLTVIAGLADPNADRMLFWDDSAGAMAYLTLGTNLSITGTTLNATGGASPGGTVGEIQINDGAGGLGATDITATASGLKLANAASGAGTTMTITGSDAGSGNSNGGDLVLSGGAKAGSGANGRVMANGLYLGNIGDAAANALYMLNAAGSGYIVGLSCNDSNNLDVGLEGTVTHVGIAGNCILRYGKMLAVETQDKQQNIQTLIYDSSYNLYVGNDDDSGGNYAGDTNLCVYSNTKKVRVLVATVEKMYVGNTDARFFTDKHILESNGTFTCFGSIVSTGSYLALGAGAATGLDRLGTGRAAILDSGSPTGWLVQIAGVAMVTSNATNATDTLANVTALGKTLKAAQKYRVSYRLYVSTDQAAEGVKFDFAGGTATATRFRWELSSNVQGATLSGSTTTGTSLSDVVTFTALSGTGVHCVVFNCEIVVNGGGTLIPRFAQVAHSSGTATLLTESSVQIADMN